MIGVIFWSMNRIQEVEENVQDKDQVPVEEEDIHDSS